MFEATRPRQADVGVPEEAGVTARDPRAEARTATGHGGTRALALGMFVLGLAMFVMALIAPVEAVPRATEAAAACAAIAGAAALARGGARNALSAGGLTLLGSLVYFAVTNTEFHAGGVGYTIGVAQFVSVPVGLVLGAAAFALVPHAAGASRRPRVADFVPDAAILAVGTILLGIALGQLANDRLMPPMWNWISFVGLTITGMLVVVVGRSAAKAALAGRSEGRGRPLAVLATELLLIAGLGVMIYGALNNLVLGANGFKTGFNGNGDGLALWAAAAFFLVVVRGGFKLAVGNRNRAGSAVIRELLYFAGAFAFIIGERSVLSGKPPTVSVGDAGPAAALMILGALLLLVPARMAAKRGRPEGARSAEPVAA